MRFKRLAAAVMAATMCGSLLVGCGGSDNKSTDNNENITATIKVWGPAEDQAEENGKFIFIGPWKCIIEIFKQVREYELNIYM
jgi:arabinogalactan oligomer / maltooligosaccharide transport system substrate-binding protein